MSKQQVYGAGLFDLRSLSTGTLLAILLAATSPLIEAPAIPKAEAHLFAMVRRILVERGEL
jgi:hypothetical protein